jgi:hypothetical protein
MGPIERELRTAPGPEATNQEFYEWCWEELSASPIPGLGMSAFRLVSDVFVKVGNRRRGRPGYGITHHSDKGLIREAISEAIEFAASEGI